MSKNVFTLVAVAILGAGLVHLAVGAGAPPVLLAVYVAVGVAELGWAVAILRRGAVPAPRAFIAVALIPLAGWAVCLAAGLGSTLPLGPLAAASLLGAAAVAVVVVGLRRNSSGEDVAAAAAADPSVEHPWRFLGTLAASAAIVAGVVTPALSGTWAGQFAVPHGSHGDPVLEIDEHSGH